MSPERWREIDELLEAALEHKPEERAAFLAETCADDEELRREVETLLAAHERASSFMVAPALEVVAKALDQGQAALPAGSTLSHYRVLSLLGAGGMGTVYLAQDTRLGRKAALKLLPPQVTADADRVRRFRQEARAASALNHPNIVTIYDIGEASTGSGSTHFIATEFVDGQTLRERLSAGPLELREAIGLAAQVANALSATHSADIVHRDIKPENVMLRRDGYVKVLDFGLAKLAEGSAEESRPRNSAFTHNSASTTPGVVMGTVAYMSPEQARGQEVDARSDIFSLGVVLYEMIAGRTPFVGVNALEVISEILKTEPAPLRSHAPGTPTELQRIVSKALCKDRGQRYQRVKDLLIDLKALQKEMEFEARRRAAARRPAPRRILAVAASTLVLSVAGLLAYRSAGPSTMREAESAPRIVPLTTLSGSEGHPSFSPDGSRVVYSHRAEGEEASRTSLYIQDLAGGAPVRLTAAAAFDYSAAWSPDGRSIAFIRVAEGAAAFHLIPAARDGGGAARRLAAAAFDTQLQSLAWFPGGRALAAADKLAAHEPFSIFRLSVETGEKRRLTSPSAPSVGDLMPAISPDGRMLAFCRLDAVGAASLYVLALDGSDHKPRRLTSKEFSVGSPTWMPEGDEVVFTAGREGRSGLWAVAAAGGAPRQLLAETRPITSLAAAPRGRRLAYSQSANDANIWRLSLTDDAPPSAVISSTFWDAGPQLSPDGRRIAFESDRLGGNEIWLADADGGNQRQLTYLGATVTGSPRWSPDGRWVAFDSRGEGSANIYLVAVDGGEVRQLTTDATEEYAPSWSRDGRWVYFGSNRGGSGQIWKIPVGGGAAAQVTRQGGFEGQESADGRFFYFTKGGDVPGIWRLPVGGGEEVCVVRQHHAGLWRPWAVTQRGIYFVTAEQPESQAIEFFNFEGGVRRIYTAKKPIGHGTSGLAVEPGGRWLLFAQADKRGGDLFLAENVR